MVAAAQKKTNRLSRLAFSAARARPSGRSRDYLQQGNLGRIVQVDAQIHYLRRHCRIPRPRTRRRRWIGTSGAARPPRSPTRPQVGHFAWRLEKTTGHGHLVDWGIHLIDATRWILGRTMPRSVQASGGIYSYKDKITTPDVLTVQFDFDACPVCWRHRIWGAEEYTPEVSNGIFFYGENGTIFVTDDRWVLIPKDKNKQREEHKASADMGTAHMAEFLSAVRSRQQPGCTVEDGYRSTATVKLAMIAYDVGAKIEWDDEISTDCRKSQGSRAAQTAVPRPVETSYES